MAIPDPAKVSNRKRAESLSHRLERLELQLSRLTDLLAQQAVSRKRRRRQFTIQFMLIAFVVFAVGFAWFANVYHQSRRQSAAIDQLIGQHAFVLYSPRESTLVSLMPGDPKQPPVSLVGWLGDDFFRAVTNVSTGPYSSVTRDKQKLITSLTSLSQLERLRLTNLRLRTSDLEELRGLHKLQSLDLSRTGLDHGSMAWIGSTQMRWFNASHTNFGDRALYDLSRCRQLQQLYLERTAVTDEGLKHLHSMTQLRYLNLKRSPVSAAAVKQLSDALPGCQIDWEPLRFLADGRVDARAAARGRVRYGRGMPDDPRADRRASPPLDTVPPVRLAPGNSRWRTETFQGYSNVIVDVY